MNNEIRISGKQLAQLNMPDSCDRCFWIKQKVKNLPFQIFPGIFSSIDAFSKKIVHAWIDRAFEMPGGRFLFPELEGVTGYLKAPHWSKFKRLDPLTGITVSGVVDDLLTYQDGTLLIPDYKTAKITDRADSLAPLYRAQLNLYKWVQDSLGKSVVRKLALVYLEPMTDDDQATIRQLTPEGCTMGFRIVSKSVEINESLPLLLTEQARDILAATTPPKGADGCKDCAAVENLMEVNDLNGGKK